jgi:serine/threonine protein kinase
MGEVYRALDARLDRTVAIKILPPHLAVTAEARQRFEREARAISKLGHPHICALFDVGSQDGFDYLVMEYLEGETLAARLDRGPLSLEEVLRIGGQIASALHTAHRQNVVHRDLKPGNVILTRSGAKLLDFGLAKPTTPPTDDDELSASPTASHPLTAAGTVVGTVQYMAPEQIEGREADARTDVFALGLVLYEMATGTRAFEGRTPASLFAAILKDEPRPLAERAPAIPRSLDRMVGTCLAKDPEERWQSARDVEIQLKALGSREEDEKKVSSKPRAPERLAWAAALLLVAILAGYGLLRSGTDSVPEPMVRSSLMPPPGLSFVPENFAISPDGSRLAFVAVGASGQSTLWVRSLSASSAQELRGAEGATYPFWAPDSGRIGFFAAGKLKTADLATGEVRELCDAPLGRGGTWNREDAIVFAPSVAGPLLHVSASGGTPQPATRLPRPDSAGAHRWPYFLPDGKHFLYFVDWTDSLENGIYVASLDAADGKLISAEITGNVVFASGHFLYVQDRRLMAQPFDPARLETTGPPVPLGEQELEKDLAFFRAGFSVSEDGLLVFQSAREAPSRLLWYDEKGNELSEVPAERLRDPRISPDGRFLAVSSDDLGNGKRFIRVFDLARGVSTNLTSGGNEEAPVWSRDGKEITYVSSGINNFSLERIPADGSGPAQLILNGARMIPNDSAPDGRLVFMSFENGPASVRVYSPDDGQVTAFGLGGEAQFSPDGKWIAHVMGAPRGGLFVQPFPGPGARIQITSGGGTQARWSRDGTQIFYIASDKKLMAVDFDPLTQTASAPRTLFQTRIVGTSFVLFQYDVAPDGRFLINSFPAERSSPLTLVTNWPRQLER